MKKIKQLNEILLMWLLSPSFIPPVTPMPIQIGTYTFINVVVYASKYHWISRKFFRPLLIRAQVLHAKGRTLSSLSIQLPTVLRNGWMATPCCYTRHIDFIFTRIKFTWKLWLKINKHYLKISIKLCFV